MAPSFCAVNPRNVSGQGALDRCSGEHELVPLSLRVTADREAFGVARCWFPCPRHLSGREEPMEPDPSVFLRAIRREALSKELFGAGIASGASQLIMQRA